MIHDAWLRSHGTRALRAVGGGLITAVVFELVTVVATQDKAIRAVSPWQDDPYDVVVSLSQFVVPMLAVVIGLRLLVWQAPGGRDRARQMLRAVAALVALVGLTASVEWIALAAGEHRASWTNWTGVLSGGLVVVSALTFWVGVLLARECRRGAMGGDWEHDWLGDVVFCCARVPVLRRWVTERRAAWVRQHAMLVFALLSAFAGVVEITPMALGERWSDPLLIGWAVIVAAAGYLAFFMISNAVAGFIARPPRRRTQRVAETSAVTGSIAVLIAVAFRAELWRLGSRHGLDSVAPLVALTLGCGVAAAALTALVMSRRSLAPVRSSNHDA